MRVAVVHDWLYVVGGAERVLREILHCYPQADVFCLFDNLADKDRPFVGVGATKTSFLQKVPFVKTKHRLYLPLMPLAIEQFDLTGYDLIISSSYSVAKGVITGPDQVHVSYIHSPMRYAWDLQHAHLRDGGYERGLKSVLARIVLHYMRIWDTRTAHGPDAVIANSHFVARRIRKTYGRKARVIYPPVTLAQAAPAPAQDYFLTASRLVPYKNIGVIVEAFAQLPDLKLVVSGDGPELERLKSIATPNVTFEGFVPNERLRALMASARAFVFAAEEDFGIVVVEALSEGAPVLALGRGGARESLGDAASKRVGMFFDEATPNDIAACVRDFVARESEFSREACRARAQEFSAERFRQEFSNFVDEAMRESRNERDRTWTPSSLATS
jgi:glycosyltransferase involved in cell wall biosynthesis